MSDAYIDDLERTLFYHEFGVPYDVAKGMDEASHRIMWLVSLVQGMEVGDEEVEYVFRMFKQHQPSGFDFELWFAERVADGTYDPLEQWDQPADDYDHSKDDNVIPFPQKAQ